MFSITCDQYVFNSFYDQTKFRSFASFSTSLPLHVTLWLHPICRIVLIFIPGFIPNFIFRVHFRDPINSVSIYPAASQVNEQRQMNIGRFLVQTDLIMYRIAVILQIWFYTNLRFPQMQGDSIKVALKPAQLQTNMFSFVYSTKILRRSTVIFCFHKCNTVPSNLNAEFKVPCFWGPWVWLPRILIHFDLWQLHSQGIHRYKISPWRAATKLSLSGGDGPFQRYSWMYAAFARPCFVENL